MHATRIAAYTYQADLYCPSCIQDTFLAARTTTGRVDSVEATLDRAARAMGIDRYDEHSYDSAGFPKVAFANQLNEESLDHCGSCGDCLAHDLSDHPEPSTEQREYRVWTESADLVHVGDDKEAAETAMAEAVQEHIASAECPGCGVLTPPGHHGYSLQIVKGDQDVTDDPNE